MRQNISWTKVVLVVLLFVFLLLIVSRFRIGNTNTILDNVLQKQKVESFSKPITPTQRRTGMWNKKCNVFKPASISERFYNATLKYSEGKAVCFVHGVHDIVSQSIIVHGVWEAPAISEMEKVFDVDPSLGLIDVGCNLGAYTIVSAMRRRKVVSVDVNIENLKRLRKSLLENKIAKRVALVYNGISDRHQNFSIKTPLTSNIGDTFMVSAKKNDARLVSSIFMDDLLEVIDFNRAIMKIDIQGHEFDGFHKADKLFTEVDIPIVMMEWILIGPHKDQKIPKYIMYFFKRFKYQAYATIFSKTPLNWNAFKTWPYDIVWKKDVQF